MAQALESEFTALHARASDVPYSLEAAARGARKVKTQALAYLAAATVMMPGLWGDPLGPLVKVGPAIALALVGLAILEER